MTNTNIQADTKPIILIIDDVPNNLKILSRMLEKEGYVVILAENGERALEIIQNIKPDLVLLDVMMPGMDGFDVCASIKQNKSTKDVPVIFLTVRDDISDVIRGFNTGSVDYVKKPFNLLELLARISIQIELKNSREANQKYIKQLQEANEELLSAKNELNELNANKDKFFTIIAHELRNPFQALLGLSEVLANNFEKMTVPENKEIIGDLKKSADNLYLLLENLLEWSRIQMGRIAFLPEKIDLKFIIDNIATLLSASATQKGIKINNSLNKSAFVFADPNMANTIIRNLISNAIKYIPNGCAIDVDAIDKEHFVEVAIRDNGQGISEEKLQNLFSLTKTYQDTYDEKQRKKGTGIGLLLCKELITKHGGEIKVESHIGEGTTFTFTLPKEKAN